MKFKVPATMHTDLYLIVEAASADEAYKIAKRTDGAEFIEEDNSGDWVIGEPVKIGENNAVERHYERAKRSK
tara:strand:+ start:99 stop:314 length:216 start_codon:yes stop_codon:yes gene_type:complete